MSTADLNNGRAECNSAVISIRNKTEMIMRQQVSSQLNIPSLETIMKVQQYFQWWEGRQQHNIAKEALEGISSRRHSTDIWTNFSEQPKKLLIRE